MDRTINPNEAVFINALMTTISSGSQRKTRNGITTAIFAHQMRFDMEKGFPAVTTKQLLFKSVTAELLWFLDAGKETGGRLSLKKLNQIQGKPDDARNIWTHDQARFAKEGKAKFDGDCGCIYGAQWRDWKRSDTEDNIDQIDLVIKKIKNDPFGRYHIVTAWNPAEIHDMCLPPCHMKMQFFVRPTSDGMCLDLSMDQRSCDLFLGVPFNIASYALLLHMMAQCVDMIPGELIITLEDCHVYLAGINKETGVEEWEKGHLEQVKTQIARAPFKAPELWLNPEIKNIDDFKMEDIQLTGYNHHEKLPADLL